MIIKKINRLNLMFFTGSILCVLIVILSGYIALKDYLPQKVKKDLTGAEVSGVLVRAQENPGMFFDINAFIRDDTAYIFLPEDTDESRLVFYTTDETGNLIERFEHDFEKDETVLIDDYKVTVMRADIPTINLAIYDGYPSLEEVEAAKKHDINTEAYFEMDDEDGKTRSGIVTMRGRGNTSWKEDKKSYQIKFEKKTDLCGMGEAKSWILLANAGDFSLLRNEVFLDLARDMGISYTPEIREVNLFINGDYRGVYSLTEKVERGKERVDLGEADYLYRIGMDADDRSFLVYENANAEGEGNFKKIYGELRDSMDLEGIRRSASYLRRAVEELYDSNSELDMIDIDSLARYYWLQEFSKTTDPTGRSVYFYWKADEDKLYTGPAWDYDRTAGIIEMPFLEEDYIWPYGWTARVRDYYVPLFKNDKFLEAVEDVYENGGVKEAFRKAADEVTDRVDRMSLAAEMNFLRWDVLEEDESNKVSEVYDDNSWESQVTWLEDWLSMRCDWIEEEME